MITQTDYKEAFDPDTEEVKRLLKQGWRLLSVCPTRHPDYDRIFHFVKEMND